MTKSDIKKWIKDNKVLFVTNPISKEDKLFKASSSTYIDYIPDGNIFIVEGTQNGKNIYNLHVFHTIIKKTFKKDDLFSTFDYLIYFDEDLFITDFETLIGEFKRFMSKDLTFVGPPDGGAYCHRNHHHNMINTFISFWNLKLIRDTVDLDELNRLVDKYSGKKWYKFKQGYGLFVNDVLSSYETKLLFFSLNHNADKCFQELEKYRFKTFKSKYSPYALYVRDDPTAHYLRHQQPYTFLDVFGKTLSKNEEPYYALQQALLLTSKKLHGFLYATDFYNPDLSPNDELTDNTGCSSVVMDENFKPFAVHTWYSCFYDQHSKHPFDIRQYNRINRIISRYGKLT